MFKTDLKKYICLVAVNATASCCMLQRHIAPSLSTAVYLPFKTLWKCIFEHWRLKLVSFGLLLNSFFSNLLSSSFPFNALPLFPRSLFFHLSLHSSVQRQRVFTQTQPWIVWSMATNDYTPSQILLFQISSHYLKQCTITTI